eukprot:CAMPEP_0113723298 /NCGR_PEP_ID=MMETSP0038_2-20120614/38327_1 /TAXON_ID=2898 /ORGANISM="Cryptomonas paramecium" /LENGTH=216 /DNA_ID=CAMNT_0000652835 /DNA_START=54 /DNA_END=702 /DNA_ORIENTATION=- /assembly_acc=CAM_ASM_000170
MTTISLALAIMWFIPIPSALPLRILCVDTQEWSANHRDFPLSEKVAYQRQEPITLTVVLRRDFSTSGASSIFHKPLVEPEYVKRRRSELGSNPGPGQYSKDLQMPKSYGKAVPFNTHAERFEPQKPASSTDEIVEASTPDYDAINRITGAFSKVWTSRPLPSSVFRSRTGRVFDESHQPLPDPSLQRLKPHPSLGPSLGIQVDIVPHSPQRDRRDE